MSKTSHPATPYAYRVELTASSTQDIWITATSEDAAIERAEALWQDDINLFTYRGGTIECIMVIETQKVQS